MEDAGRFRHEKRKTEWLATNPFTVLVWFINIFTVMSDAWESTDTTVDGVVESETSLTN
jgi:hypothetical protein